MNERLKNFDISLLEDPDFKEDAVREEIVAPLLWSVGFAAHGPAQIVRSKPLEHPFVSIGSTRRRVSIVPDYQLKFDGKVVCVLDAKAPSENVLDPDHLSQVYSYCVHRDVQAAHYALCNGHRFVMFRVAEMSNRPILDFELHEIESRWPMIEAALSPINLRAHGGMFAKDFGLHIQRLGVSPETVLVFPGFPIVQLGKRGGNAYSLMANTEVDGSTYAACFDFDQALFEKLLRQLPSGFAENLRLKIERLATGLMNIGTNGPSVTVNISSRLSVNLVETEKEIFRPLVVVDFLGNATVDVLRAADPSRRAT
jgi:hypothetical protein